MRTRAIRISIVLMAIFLLPLLVLTAEQTSWLLIDGPQGEAKVIQVQGKNYVEIDELARITGGSLRFVGNQIILKLPASDPASQTEPLKTAQPVGISRPFLNLGIETMREILEWHAALKTSIERGYPLSEVWLGNYRRQIQSTLKQTEAAASTDLDQKALPLLVEEFNNMGALTDKYVDITASRDYFAPDSLNGDPLDQKVLACWRSMERMVSSNQFVDDGACQ